MSPSVRAPAPPVLRHPPFALYWVARVLSVLAFNMQAVAIGWQLYDLTGNPLDLGLVGLAHFLPLIGLSLLAGHAADRFDRRAILVVCRLIEGLAAVALAVGTLAGWLGRESILGIVVLVGAARTFEDPAVAALVPSLVPRPVISRATAMAASANQLAKIAGPALGGLLYLLGPAAAYSTVATCFLLGAGLTTLIRIAPVERRAAAASLRSVFSGLGFVRRDPVIFGTLSLDLAVVLFGGATALLPIYARDILGTGPWGLGLLRAAPGAGALVTSLVLARHPLRRRVGPILFAVIVIFGLATVVFGLSTSLPLSLAALAVLGAADVVSVVIRFSLVQIRTPDAMRGRVSAVNSLFVGTSNQLGEFESGLAAALFGAVPAVLIGGLGTILAAIAWCWLFPSLFRTRGLED